ncbi:DNA translocase FtsK 4TM domain-containing protein [Acinetobacter bohemicus]|uniref:DNA translocase FtsK n=1 Tax=Acinetobacter TaxID=469 RepID=UPI00209A9B26|nr:MULTISPECIES: DNA translocase FtsK [Acinetobacter]MCO8042819.1 DNA translocase FtsK 4TM domain-containing protein [Acinetobacter sp. S4400-12]MCO8045574.1 DNA translocase FtsK 4TM domain-containing protein [Acinetobacter sp. S4397-1]MCU7225051.1 DNA translocase FtsK 4TM domain-containing protein [Acinetobacter bohemicus]
MTAVSSAYAQRLVMTLFLVSFGIYLFLATVTYTPFDPGWMHISSDTQTVSNASGVAGAWISDLLFGFLGWASLLLPVYLFVEAIQVWWPHSFLNRPFRYAAQFFLLLTSSALLFLFWQVPADTLDNSSGGIIGYELGQSLEQLLTVYGATFFLLVLWVVLFTLAFGVKWNKTWSSLKATPAYLQDLFYRNVPEGMSDFDRTAPVIKKEAAKTAAQKVSVPVTAAPEHKLVDVDPVVRDQVAERLFDDFAHKEAQQIQIEEVQAEAPVLQPEPDVAIPVPQHSDRVVATGEVWRALNSNEDQRHAQDIDALLKAAEEEQHQPAFEAPHASASGQPSPAHPHKTGLDWDDNAIFDELLAAVPQGKTASDVHSPFTAASSNKTLRVVENTPATAVPVAASIGVAHRVENTALEVDFDDLDDLLVAEDEPKPVRASSYAQSSAFVQAPIQRAESVVSSAATNAAVHEALSKEEFIDAWQETAGKPQDEDEFDFDAPLTDAAGRPMSRAMQVAERRKDLSPLPGLDLLDEVDPNKKVNFTEEQLSRLSELLEIKLQEFNVKAKVVEAQPGPVVTRFELDLAPGVKASKVTNISRDLARSMSMASVRVVEVIPGKPYIGIEVPNSTREMVRLIELLTIPAFTDPNSILSMAMGKDISGNPVIADLGKAPHMLVAGTTGSGKSVAVNSMILSMLLKYTPDQLRLILIDPKQLELANYNDIPHLLTPVVTDMKDAVSALNWCVNEMERRYKLMSFLKIRKLSDYNRKVEEAIANGEELFDPTWKASESVAGERAPRLMPLPSIVIVADEFADMIMQVGKKAEEMITRLAQKSRAAGIHLLLATQRPSVDVITGLIKANIPTRVALRVNSKIDSRTILDAGGAEDLLGHGDMLFLGPGKIEPERVHGAFIADDEVNRICDAWRERGAPNYVDEILTPYDEEPSSRGFEDGGEGGSDRDALYDQCVAFVLETRKASTSSLQRKFSLGYNRAARIIDQMEENGIVSSMGANGKREILV